MKAALFFRTVLALAAILAAPAVQAQRVIYVDTDAVGANDGSSWANAFVFLQDGLAAAQDGDEVWVAEGVYRPDQGAGITPGDREASFLLNAGVSLFGGFSGWETIRPSHDWMAHPSLLTGDLLGNDNGNLAREEPSRSDNSCHVVTAYDSGSPIRMEGFNIRDGNASSTCSFRGGGGIRSELAELTLRDVRIEHNTGVIGAGMFHSGGHFGLPGGLWADRIELASNRADVDGGGLYAQAAFMEIWDSIFERNQAGFAGGLYTDGSVVLVVKSGFYGNDVSVQAEGTNLSMIGCRVQGETTPGSGSGIVLSSEASGYIVNTLIAGNQVSGSAPVWATEKSVVEITNSTVADNSLTSSAHASAIWCQDCTVRVLNAILWSADDSAPLIATSGTAKVSIGSSIVRSGTLSDFEDLGGNLDSDPLFIDPAGLDGLLGTPDDDFGLMHESPAVDAGSGAYLPADSLDIDFDGNVDETLPLDLAGMPRVVGPTVDIGALEAGSASNSVGEPSQPAIFTFSVGDPFPNPFVTTASVEISTVGAVVVQAFDLLGRAMSQPIIVQRTLELPTRINVDGSNWAPGIYMVVIQSRTHRAARTIVRMRHP